MDMDVKYNHAMKSITHMYDNNSQYCCVGVWRYTGNWLFSHELQLQALMQVHVHWYCMLNVGMKWQLLKPHSLVSCRFTGKGTELAPMCVWYSSAKAVVFSGCFHWDLAPLTYLPDSGIDLLYRLEDGPNFSVFCNVMADLYCVRSSLLLHYQAMNTSLKSCQDMTLSREFTCCSIFIYFNSWSNWLAILLFRGKKMQGKNVQYV